MPLEENAVYQKMIHNRRIIILSPNLSLPDVQEVYPKDTLLMDNWTDVVNELRTHYQGSPSVAVFPCASIQLAYS